MHKQPYLLEFIDKKLYDSLPESFEEFLDQFKHACISGDSETIRNLISYSLTFAKEFELSIFRGVIVDMYYRNVGVWRWFTKEFLLVSMGCSIECQDVETTKAIVEYLDGLLEGQDIDTSPLARKLLLFLSLWAKQDTKKYRFLCEVTNRYSHEFKTLVILSETMRS